MKLSALEQRLLAFVYEQFGEPLTRFLLAGLGDNQMAQVWLFTIEFTEHGTKLRREVQVSASEHLDDSTRLPQRREPLVILALLRLLVARDQTSSASLSYDLEEVLESARFGCRFILQAQLRKPMGQQSTRLIQ
jgi:hypothetical protein